LVIFVIFSDCELFADVTDSPVKSDGDLLFYLDTSSFRARGDRTYQEFYYQIPFSELHFNQNTTGIFDTLLVSIQICDTSSQPLIEDQWLLPMTAKNWQDIEGRFWPDLFELTMEPGTYLLKMTIKEPFTNHSGKAELPFSAKSFMVDSLIFSDVQLASKITPNSLPNKFVKNNLEVLPNPNRVFGKTLQLLYFYMEIYNLSPVGSVGSYDVTYEVLDFQGNLIRSLAGKTKKKKNSTALEVGMLNIATLGNFAYFLKLSLKDNDTGQILNTKRGFWNRTDRMVQASSESPPVVENNIMRMINLMNEEKLTEHFQKLKYFMPINQINLYQKLQLPEKRTFLCEFWRSLDTDSTTPDNEFLGEFKTRVDFATRHYSGNFKAGWRTECGRIIIKYGIPDDITREDLRSSNKPYQEWFYNKEGGMTFIFVDEEGFGNFRLIYSSKETEFTDLNWKGILGR